VEEVAELVAARAAVQCDRNPQHVHHREAGEEQPVKHGAVGFPDDALGAFRVVGYGGIAYPGQCAQNVGQFAAAVVPAQVQPFGGEVDAGRMYAGHALQAALDQPYAGGAMDAFDEQVDVAHITGAGGEFLLHFVEVVDLDIFGRFGRWAEQRALRGAPVIALQPRLEDGAAHRLAAETAEAPFRAVQPCAVIRAVGDGQAAVKAVAGAVGSVHVHWREKRLSADYTDYARFNRESLTGIR